MKKLCAIILVMVLVTWPLSASAATLGYSTDSGTVGGYNFNATLNVSTTSAYATFLATHPMVRIMGSASAYNHSTFEFVELSMNASGVDYYVEKTAYGNSNLEIRNASTYFYVNNMHATNLYSVD